MKALSYRYLLNLSWPLMFGTFIQSVVTFTDAIFVSELGEVTIGAFGNGSLLYVSFFMFCRGLADGTQIRTAFLDGKGTPEKIGATLLHGQLYQLIISIAIFLALSFLGTQIIQSISHWPEIVPKLTEFISIRSWGIFFAAQHILLVGFFIGIGKTRVVMYAAFLIAFSNISLDYCLIKGAFGFPELGFAGAPLASSISEMLGFFFLLVALIKNQKLKIIAYSRKIKIQFAGYLDLISLSFPLMVQGVISLSTWLVFFTLIEKMGTASLEIAHNIRYMYFLAFVPIFGFGHATKTVISNLRGEGNLRFAWKVKGRLMLLSIGFLVFFFHGALLYPEFLIRLVDQNPDISPQVLNDSVYILQFISGSILIFSVSTILYNSISGLGETIISAGIEIIGIIFYLIGCDYFIILWNWDIKSVWWVEYIYFISFFVFSLAYLLYYYRTKKIT